MNKEEIIALIRKDKQFSINNCKEEKDGKQITNSSFIKMFETCAQSGFQSRNDFETSVIGQDRKYVNIKNYKPFVPKTVIKAETINAFKRTNRSGYQTEVKNYEKLSTYERLLLMGAREPNLVKNKGLYGNNNGANGHNGWKRQDLLKTTYIDEAGNNV